MNNSYAVTYLVQNATYFMPIPLIALHLPLFWYTFGTKLTMRMDTLSGMGAAEIAAELRREILNGGLPRHLRLPAERRMAEAHGVARNTVREALARLAEEGFVDIRPGSGTYVVFQTESPSTSKAIEQAGPLELMDARFALEPHICRLCVLHGRRVRFDSLDSLCARMEAALQDPVAFSEADTEFHRTLAETTGNGLLSWIIGQINSVRSQDEWTLMRQLTLNEEMIEQYNLQHRQILDAIRKREPERAATLMTEHLETARLSLTRAASA